jgi:hypothetical protein
MSLLMSKVKELEKRLILTYIYFATDTEEFSKTNLIYEVFRRHEKRVCFVGDVFCYMLWWGC